MRKWLSTLGQLLLWSLRDYRREPAALFWTLGFPILMTLTLGQMGSQAHRLRATVAVLAQPADQARAQAWAAGAPGGAAIRWIVLAPQALAGALATGQVRLGLEQAWDPAARRWRFDPADNEALLDYHRLRDLLDGRPSDAEPLHVPGARYIDFLLPGLLALGLVNSCLWGVGWGLVELREKRLLRLMLATPLTPGAFFTALFLGRLVLSLAEASILLVFSALLFHVRVQGSLPALLTLWTCGVVGFFGLATLVGSRTDRPSVGQGLINAVTLPMFVVSGVFFGLDNFPPLLQRIFRVFPPTLMVDATRQVVNSPAGWAQVAPACAALLAMGALCHGLARRWFRFY